jgi:hypothetical protein
MLIGATAKKSKDVTVDKREPYLLVEAETWAETVGIPRRASRRVGWRRR